MCGFQRTHEELLVRAVIRHSSEEVNSREYGHEKLMDMKDGVSFKRNTIATLRATAST